jgi:NTP pyrophosphatase (non-canonical NTP hydrolase)
MYSEVRDEVRRNKLNETVTETKSCTDEERLSAIFKKIGRKAVLEQAIEECGEFIQAAAKHLRILRGTNYTPVKLADNANDLLEETSDVLLCMELLAVSLGPDTGETKRQIAETKRRKLDRWTGRLGITG